MWIFFLLLLLFFTEKSLLLLPPPLMKLATQSPVIGREKLVAHPRCSGTLIHLVSLKSKLYCGVQGSKFQRKHQVIL